MSVISVKMPDDNNAGSFAELAVRWDDDCVKKYGKRKKGYRITIEMPFRSTIRLP